jgi:hypothetical protein
VKWRSLTHNSVHWGCYRWTFLDGNPRNPDVEYESPMESSNGSRHQHADQKSGGKKTAVVSGLRNTALGLFYWHAHFGHVVVPTVCSKNHWTRRKLSHKELADTLGVPVTISWKACPNVLSRLTHIPIPGNFVTCMFNGVIDGKNGSTAFDLGGSEVPPVRTKRREGRHFEQPAGRTVAASPKATC